MPDEPRRYRIVKRTKSLSVNVCDKNNRLGQYDWIVRIFLPDEVTEAEIEAHGPLIDEAAIERLVEWLKAEKHGEIEKRPPPPIVEDRGIAAVPPPEEDRQWIERAVAVVEQSIDQLVFEFLRVPYQHRVEHSLHARLFAILSAQPHLSRELPLSDGTLTQPIRKEWPETIASPETRRGNLDLAILSPALLRAHSVEAFRNGNIAAPIVIEMGLDYGAAHLGHDAEKLIQSQVQHGYLVHFTRRAPSGKERELVLNPGGTTKVAFACPPSGQYKPVNGTEILSGT
jgi:hypothetical protein